MSTRDHEFGNSSVIIELLKDVAPGVGFGTSGVRALVSDLTPEAVWVYARTFIQHLRQSSQLETEKCVIGWDLRPSSPGIATVVAAAVRNEGLAVDWAGQLPTPALALRCLNLNAPGIMITGSHIPFDRNGIKFYTGQGEILKVDEAGMSALDVSALKPDPTQLSGLDAAQTKIDLGFQEQDPALIEYRDRYLNLFAANALAQMRVGVYQHSAVGRDFLADLLSCLGAEVIHLGRSETFVPIDTEAVSEEDEAQAAKWCKEFNLDALVSTDGDGDRPWICDEAGRFVRGDLIGILTAQWLGADSVVTPINSNTALEKSGYFKDTIRTKIGSPYVIEAMRRLESEGAIGIVGFEANGGLLVQGSLQSLQSLPTRDSTLPILATLSQLKKGNLKLSQLIATLPKRYVQSGRLQNVDPNRSKALIRHLSEEVAALTSFLHFTGSVPTGTDETDGLRITMENGEIIHFRSSGNAPELRCYVEAGSTVAAAGLLKVAIERIGDLLMPPT